MLHFSGLNAEREGKVSERNLSIVIVSLAATPNKFLHMSQNENTDRRETSRCVQAR